MGKTFRKNSEFGGSTAASHVRRYRTHNRTKTSNTLHTSTDEFHRGRNYQKSAVAWNPSPHGRRAPGRKGMPMAYAASARARRQQQVERQAHEWQLVTNDHVEECHDTTHPNQETKTIVDSQEEATVAEWYTPLIVKAGCDIFRMHHTYSYSLAEYGNWPTSCLVRKIGDKFYCLIVDELMDYPDIAYDDDLWIVHSVGIITWKQSTTFMLPENKNTTNLQGEFVSW